MKARERFLTPTGAMRAWATMLMLILGFGLALGLTIGYVNKVDQQAERRNIERSRDWCRILILLDNRNQQLPPSQDKDTMDFRREIHDLRVSKGC